MVETYQQTDDATVQVFRRIHGNGEQTHVSIVSVGGRDYAVVAYDVRPQDYTPVAAEVVGYDPTIEGAAERAERWMETHPKGVAYAYDGQGGNGGTAQKLWDGIKRLGKRANDYGNDMTDDIQHGGKQQ